MHSIDPGGSFARWRDAARRALAAGLPPHAILWEKPSGLLAGIAEEPAIYDISRSKPAAVPADFIELARNAACHADPGRWALLYRILWRITRGGERQLTAIATDPDTARARLMEKNVRREIHKMHAFVRFRLTGRREDGREVFVAWFEPEHHIVEAAAPFFRKRFANMDWSIFTPKGCAHWDGSTLAFSPGIPRDPCGDPDALEAAWRTYYRSIFNPARLKTRAMQSEMPKRYWKNLPEAELIGELVRDSRRRTAGMIHSPPLPPKPEPGHAYLEWLRKLPENPDTPPDAAPPGGS